MARKIQEPVAWQKAKEKEKKDDPNQTSGKTSWSKKEYLKDLQKADPNYKESGQERSDDIFKDLEGM